MVAACGIAVLLVGVNLLAADPQEARSGPVPYVELYWPPETPAEVIVNQGDGQAFAALAQDPLLRRPEAFGGDDAEAAYRAQRPLLGWLVWATSAGQAEAVPGVLLAWAVAGAVALAWGTRVLAARFGRRWDLAALAVLLPGSVAVLDWTGPEGLAAGAALLALWWWRRSARSWAVVLLVVASLLRETMVLVAVAIGVWELVRDPRGWRSLVPLLAAPLAVLAWWEALRWRFDALPTDAASAGEGRLGVPFAGLVGGIGYWDTADAVVAFVLAALLVAAVWQHRSAGRQGDGLLWAVVGVYGLLGILLGTEVWKRWQDFGRALLPLSAVAFVLALPVSSTPPGAAVAGAGDRLAVTDP